MDSLRKSPLQDLFGEQGEVSLILLALDNWFTIGTIDLLSVMKFLQVCKRLFSPGRFGLPRSVPRIDIHNLETLGSQI